MSEYGIMFSSEEIFRKKILKPLLREINDRQEETNSILTTNLFEDDDWIFQQDGARPHQPIVSRPSY